MIEAYKLGFWNFSQMRYGRSATTTEKGSSEQGQEEGK
jgi:hypothetical protein